jgi:histone-lysine N-methyltransferase SETMAR
LHVGKMSRQKIQELGWEILSHPAYWLDLASSDYHVFRVLKHHLREMKFDAQPTEFWQKGIEKLPDRWA